jgi:hypothetical protein
MLEFLDPIEKLERKALSTVANAILLRASISQTAGATEETGGRTIHQTRKVH